MISYCRVSVLDTMCADLISLLTDEANPQLVLEELDRESMFLVPLDTRREWFRFHHLFRDMLRFKLRAERPDLEPHLLNQAARWHLERGQVNSGLGYLLRARNWDHALEVIMARGSEVFEKGEMATVIRWISEVPESAREHRPDVSLLLGILMVLEGQAARAEDILGRVLAHVNCSAGERICAHVFLATMVQWRPRPEVSIDAAVRALDELDHVGDARVPTIMNLTHAASLETMAVISRGRAHFQAGDLEQARIWLERGLATQGASYPIWKVSALGSLGLVEALLGNTEEAVALSDEALTIAKEMGLLAHPSIAEAYLTSAHVALERGEPGRASVSLHEGILRAGANGRNQLSWFGHLESALLLEADGKRAEALTCVLSARSDLGAPAPPVVADRLIALQCRLLRLDGTPEQGQRALRSGSSDSAVLRFERAAAALTLGNPNLARKFVDTYSGSTDSKHPLPMLDGLFLAAWLAQTEQSFDVARMHLTEALAVAEGHSLVESFVRAGPTMVGMVSDLPDAHSDLRTRILRRAQALASPSQGYNLVEPLTDRELEILSYLPSRFTNTELADHLYVSVNTIKTHMAHIYRKLGVANRNRAISRAREIGVLQPV